MKEVSKSNLQRLMIRLVMDKATSQDLGLRIHCHAYHKSTYFADC